MQGASEFSIRREGGANNHERIVSYSAPTNTAHAPLERCAEGCSAVKALVEDFDFGRIIGRSSAVLLQIERARSFVHCEGSVHVSGETGTGKEIFARAIHYTSLRSSNAFVPVNCGALPTELVENELFGHEIGAFTGAGRARKGLIAQPEGGTLFLDEIDSLPLTAQAKLLRFLQEREYRPLGTALSRHSDVRVISASNIDLPKAISAGKFRDDLFFRLSVLPLSLPALRHRCEDIPLLADHFLVHHGANLLRHAKRRKARPSKATGSGPVPTSFTAAALSKLMQYHWPGNVRELENVIERALVLAKAIAIDAHDIDVPVREQSHRSLFEQSFKVLKKQAIYEFEHHFIQEILAKYDGNIRLAAKAAKTERRTFFGLARKHKLTSTVIKSSVTR
jgi:two-component system, NtrC family, response regulator GlrR